MIFSGYINNEHVGYTITNLENPVKENYYRCSDHFKTDILKTSLINTYTYGLLIVERGGACIGTYSNSGISVVTEVRSKVMGKHSAGGQSAQRFERDIERQKQEFFKEVAEIVNHQFITNNGPNIKGLLIGGSNITSKQFVKQGYLNHKLKQSILGRFRVTDTSISGLNQLVSKGKQVIEDENHKEEIKMMEKFYEGLTEETSVYGEQEVEKMLNYGAVETLLLSEELDKDEHQWLIDKAKGTGSEIVFVSTTFDKGNALKEVFGGIAATLRYSPN